MIDFKKSNQPESTMRLKDNQIDALTASKEFPKLPEFPSHGQTVERAVKIVTEVSHQMYVREARHKYISTKEKLKEFRTAFETKTNSVVF